jgi:drug/metabolite transporter (DMT)-like permease
LTATAVVSVLSDAIYVPVYLVHAGLHALVSVSPVVIVVQVIAQGVLSGVVALFAFARAVQDLGPGRAALFPALSPGVAILLGIPATGDWPSAVQLAGLGLLTSGLVIAVKARHS